MLVVRCPPTNRGVVLVCFAYCVDKQLKALRDASFIAIAVMSSSACHVVEPSTNSGMLLLLLSLPIAL